MSRCELCGEVFETTRPNKRFCCEDHRRTAERRRAGQRDRKTKRAVCAWCGAEFMASPRRDRFCCKSHAAAWGNVQRYGWPSSPVAYAGCEECGAVFIKKRGRKTCSEACSLLRWRRQVRHAQRKRTGCHPARWQPAGLYECAHCGEWFVVAESRPHARKFCSAACNNAAGAHRRRIVERKAEGSHTGREWREKLHEYGGRCAYCGVVLEPPSKTNPRSRTKDHVVPLSLGGTDDIDNIVPACLRCNGKKGASLEYSALTRRAQHEVEAVVQL